MAPGPFLGQGRSMKSQCVGFSHRDAIRPRQAVKIQILGGLIVGHVSFWRGKSESCQQGNVPPWRHTWLHYYHWGKLINGYENHAPSIGDPVKASTGLLLSQRGRAQSYRYPVLRRVPVFGLVLCRHHLENPGSFFNKSSHIITLY